jgi:hypothetical protein
VSYSSEVLADTPAGYWRLNEAAASATVADSSGNGHTGTSGAVGSAMPTYGVAGAIDTDPSDTAATFDGNDTIVLPDLGLAEGASGVTIECWMRWTILSTRVAYAEGSTAGATPILYLGIDATGKAAFRYRNDANQDHTHSSTASYNDDGWRHFVGVYDKGTGFTALYVNGSAVGTPVAVTAGTITVNTATIGFSRRNTDGLFWTGGLDELAVYDYALSSARVAAHYAAAFAQVSLAPAGVFSSLLVPKAWF